MGNHLSHNAWDNTLTPPPGYVVPSFPSLYNPGRELGDSDGLTKGAYYLYYSKDIYRFCLYWTLILYVPLFFLCGLYGAVVHVISKQRQSRKRRSLSPRERRDGTAGGGYRTSGLIFLVPVGYLLAGMLFGAISSAVVGYALAAVYSVGLFSMSTWVPFLWSMVVTLVTIMGSYSTILTIL
ncbi:hypothetical protein FRB94_002730 [Tulasnella sp. JGI-2019a]|nr:hypothetical protein FRB94_002730 [Tulasnella sp. JGI-2019a]KAG9013338.1 hypothetical protein FRB93_000861 [Tulasnella sp. JGI-2019a]KAG9032921.1 hypothetical protein FRB95_000855 [Tulasnella sp. JGI-2019a]